MAKRSNRKNYLGYISIFLILAFGAAYIYSNFSGNKVRRVNTQKRQKVEIPFRKDADLVIISAAGDTIKKLNTEIAEDDFHTQQGLMYRSSMDDDNSMIFIFPDEQKKWFFMKNTQIGLDIIYADKNGKIVSFAKYAKPYDETSLPSNFPAMYVLEVNDGLVDKWNVNVGDIIKWDRIK